VNLQRVALPLLRRAMEAPVVSDRFTNVKQPNVHQTHVIAPCSLRPQGLPVVLFLIAP
jgi:hypothetical protein